jgi:ribonuclease M5
MDLQNNNIKEVVVVEGYHDLAKLKSIYPDIDVVITNGSEISLSTLNELKSLNKQRGLILFLDPDYQGERIRRLINDYVGETKHAFLSKKDCISSNKKKVGIEHASREKIIQKMRNHYSSDVKNNEYSVKDMVYYGLMGETDSKSKRKELCETLGIGLCNSKTLIKKLNMFQIERDKIEKILKR